MTDVLEFPQLRLLFGFAIAIAVAMLAFRVRALSASGAVAAVFVGGSMVASGGWWAGVVLITFFATSSALSSYASTRSLIGEQVRAKRRDAVQVLANGGIPAVCAVASAFAAESGPWLVAMMSAIAGAAADTWATELGRFSRSWPRLITSWKAVAPGTSGAMSRYGTLASLAGSLLIALVAASGSQARWIDPGIPAWTLAWIVALAGMAGSILDSLLGATVQAGYYCPVCDLPGETPRHRCGAPATHVRGIRWMNNDTVNVTAILGSACLGFVLSWIWQSPG